MRPLQRFWSGSRGVVRGALRALQRELRLGGWVTTEWRVHRLGSRSAVLVGSSSGRGRRQPRPRRLGYQQIGSLRVEHVDRWTYEDWFLVIETGVGRSIWIDLDAPRSGALLDLLATRLGFDPAACPDFFALREVGSVVLFARDFNEVTRSVEPHDRSALQ